MPHKPNLATDGKGMSSTFNGRSHFRSVPPGKSWQVDNLNQYLIVRKGKCLVGMAPVYRGILPRHT